MKHVFLVGCPRSGTTWLQMLLAQHPAIATAQETHVFSSYIQPLVQQWQRDAATPRGIGVQAAMTGHEFNALCGSFARSVLDGIAAGHGSADVVLEKTPAHVRHLPLIIKLIPDAYIIHIVRDPRSVAVSLTKAGQSWGKRWAADNHADSADRWVSDVTCGQRGRELTARFRQVHYEDLLGEAGASELSDLCGWLGLETDADFSARAFADCRIDRLRDKTSDVRARGVIADDPNGFYGVGQADGWKNTLTARQLRLVEYIAGPTMSQLGYSPASQASPGHKPFALRLRSIVNAVEWRARRWLDRSLIGLRKLAS